MCNLLKAADALIQSVKNSHPQDFVEGGRGFLCLHMKALDEAVTAAKVEEEKYAPVAGKPHYGRIRCWRKSVIQNGHGLGYVILGYFIDHPLFAGEDGNTSLVISHDEKTGEIETRNSRYTLVGEEQK